MMPLAVAMAFVRIPLSDMPPPAAVGVWVVGLTVVPLLCYYLITLPLRRQERATLFLHIVETSLAHGTNLERSLVALATAEEREPGPAVSFLDSSLMHQRPFRWAAWLATPRREQVLGRGLQRLATLLRVGVPFDEALAMTRGLVPPRVSAMLAVGSEAGDLSAVLPACRRTLRDATSSVRGAMNYLVVLASGFFFMGILVLAGVFVFIIPRVREMMADMSIDPPPVLSLWLGRHPFLSPFFLTACALAAVLVAAAALYIAGPGLLALLGLRSVGDRAAMLVPWRRRRLERDFSALLALLLDAGVTEEQAVELAARGTANRVFVRRAEAVVAAIESGERLAEALARLDETGDLRWHLANALERRGGFLGALQGWHAALDAKAFQQEQAAGQVISTALMLANGAIVALLAIGVFQFLLATIQATALW